MNTMILTDERRRQIDDIMRLSDKICATTDTLRPKREDQYAWLLAARDSKLVSRYRDGEMVGMLLVSNKKHYQEPCETYGFLRYLLGSQEDVSSLAGEQALPPFPDIYWLGSIAVDPDVKEGLARGMVEEAIGYAIENSPENSLVAMGIMDGNDWMRELAADCGFKMIPKQWSQDDFASDGSYSRDFAWHIFYRLARES